MRYLIISILMINALIGKEITFKKEYKIEDILNSKQWNQLMYYKKGVSEVNDKNYFLSENGKENSKEELLATIENYKTENVNEESAICKFPARYYFISKYVELENYKEINEKCEKLKNWNVLKNTESISVMLVSGYISNPASTFGHSFIKLNTKENNDLFSSSLNYGALVPDNENMVAYIIKGLSGLYEAGYSDKYFYNQDLTYSGTEFRDMWEYKLNTTEEERKLILFHIWEITGKKYDYYFLSKNCGYRITEMLNLITEKDMLDKNQSWFLPVETFQDLEEKEKNKIKEIKFIPSNKRVFYAYYEKLNKEEQKITKEMILKKERTFERIEGLKEENKINVLDFLILYYKQTIIIEPENKELEEIKNKILVERFKYGISKKREIKIEEMESPAKNTDPINVEISTGYDSYEKEYMGISFSPFKQTSLGISNLRYDDLIALDGRIGIKENKIFLDKFDLIKIKKINTEENNVLGEFQYNWDVNIGIEKLGENIKTFSNFGVGKTIYSKDNFIIYSFLNTSINDDSYISLIPNIGIEYKYNKVGIKIIQEKEIGIIKEENKDITNVNILYNINKEYNVGYELKYEEDSYKNLINMKIKF